MNRAFLRKFNVINSSQGKLIEAYIPFLLISPVPIETVFLQKRTNLLFLCKDLRQRAGLVRSLEISITLAELFTTVANGVQQGEVEVRDRPVSRDLIAAFLPRRILQETPVSFQSSAEVADKHHRPLAAKAVVLFTRIALRSSERRHAHDCHCQSKWKEGFQINSRIGFPKGRRC